MEAGVWSVRSIGVEIGEIAAINAYLAIFAYLDAVKVYDDLEDV